MKFDPDTVSTSNLTDGAVELTFGFASVPQSAYTANGTVKVTHASSQLTGSNTNFGTEISQGDLVRVWNPLFPSNFFVSVVNSVSNTTILTLNDTISNASVEGSGFMIDKVLYPHAVFLNPQNDQVARYYNQDLTAFDTYDTFQVKMDLLAETSYTVPKLRDLRVVAVSS
jgi:hypothetical protein